MTPRPEPRPFPVVELGGAVGELHAADPFPPGEGAGSTIDGPTIWWCRPSRPALVLGSRQTPAIVDLAACARAGVDVVNRRSGGGAVLVEPTTMLWLDIVVPRTAMPEGVDADDVRASMVWAGERWAAALAAAGADDGERARLTVHHGAMVTSDWSELVCFAGVGPGEVLVGDRKLVGLSQRRTRRWLRIQGLLHLAPAAIDITSLLAVDVAPAGAPPLPATCGVDPAQLIRHLALGTRGGDWGGLGEIG
jgi:lipoate-protein ligase A